jgi:hypothetical protein
MKRLMHFVICLALSTFLIPLNSYAQENKGERMRKHMENTTPEERADFQTNRMQEFLTLSDEQTEKVREINLKYAKEMQQIFESEGPREEKKSNMRALHEQKQNELKEVFSEEQYEKYRSKKKEMKKQMKERRKE